MCQPHAALIPIYWNRARPVRLPLPIIPGVNATTHRFGGFGIRRRRNQSPGRNIPVRTFADWNAPPLGFLEIDLVVHHGGSLWGSMIHSLVATDICTVSRTALSSLKLTPACLSLDFRLHWRLIGQCER